MEKLDYENLGFAYHKTKYRYISRYKDGKWDKGELSEDENIVLNESSSILQYCQQVFEGMKAYRTKDNRVVLFRPDLNALRFYNSCLTMQIPPVEIDVFVKACIDVVKANIDAVPPFESGASLYLRPYAFGTNPILGVKPASEFEFRVFASPVGPYFKGDGGLRKLVVPDFDRAAPHGTGNIKAGLNYAMSLHPYVLAHEKGYDENLYLDPIEHKYVEETGGANVIFIDCDGKLVTPLSNTILPSITRRSILDVAKDYCGIEVEERKITIDELKDMKECGLCGTAAVISYVGSVTHKDTTYTFEQPSKLKLIRETLLAIQKGDIQGPSGWVVEIK